MSHGARQTTHKQGSEVYRFRYQHVLLVDSEHRRIFQRLDAPESSFLMLTRRYSAEHRARLPKLVRVGLNRDLAGSCSSLLRHVDFRILLTVYHYLYISIVQHVSENAGCILGCGCVKTVSETRPRELPYAHLCQNFAFYLSHDIMHSCDQ